MSSFEGRFQNGKNLKAGKHRIRDEHPESNGSKYSHKWQEMPSFGGSSPIRLSLHYEMKQVGNRFTVF